MAINPNRLLPVETAVDAVNTQASYSGRPTYCYQIPPITPSGADDDLWDIFNAVGSGNDLLLLALYATPELDVAAAPSVSLRIDCIRTSAVGTGGTAHNEGSATVDDSGGNITPLDSNNALLPTEVTARVQPSGGATADDWLLTYHVDSEEATQSEGFSQQRDNILEPPPFGQCWVLHEGEGLLVRNGPVGSAGDIGFTLFFALVTT